MNHTNLKFDSKRSPGSVVVIVNNEPVAMIVKCKKSCDSAKLRKNQWFTFATTANKKLTQQICSVPFGTYDTVKERLIQALTQGDAP